MTPLRRILVPPAVGAVLVAALVLAEPLSSAAHAGVAPQPSPAGEWPLRPRPRVVDAFDPPSSPYSAGHRGVDLAGVSGQRVRAALPGTVTYAAPLAGRGVVVISHGATRTTYQPVTASVSIGDTVAAGDPIGRLDLPGSHCSPRACLHWGWIEGEIYLDPLRLVGAGPVRLLPLWRDLGRLGHDLGRGLPGTGAGAVSPYAGWRPTQQLLDVFGTA